MRRAAGLLSSGQADELPETFWYSVKRRMLGPPLVTEQLKEERLSKPLALGVLSCDGISSANYGSELILHELLPFFGLASFTLLMPLTGVILLGIFLVVLSYREVVTVYTRAGGSYVVARENFGPRVAQVAAVALMVDYVVTVAVQNSAGSAAILSTFPALARPLGDTATLLLITVAATLAHVLREPARRPGERPGVRAADLPVLRVGRPDDHRRGWPASSSAAASRTPPGSPGPSRSGTAPVP